MSTTNKHITYEELRTLMVKSVAVVCNYTNVTFPIITNDSIIFRYETDEGIFEEVIYEKDYPTISILSGEEHPSIMVWFGETYNLHLEPLRYASFTKEMMNNDEPLT